MQTFYAKTPSSSKGEFEKGPTALRFMLHQCYRGNTDRQRVGPKRGRGLMELFWMGTKIAELGFSASGDRCRAPDNDCNMHSDTMRNGSEKIWVYLSRLVTSGRMAMEKIQELASFLLNDPTLASGNQSEIDGPLTSTFFEAKQDNVRADIPQATMAVASYCAQHGLYNKRQTANFFIYSVDENGGDRVACPEQFSLGSNLNRPSD
ncbi:hypothetical protein BDR05DRAFT_993509 [Suillus weaverae]|nr:hypothetical protein BDR05DRAFT_993509 [Suillus weaverae]